MTVNDLATEVIRFVVQGVQEVLAAYDAIGARAAAFAAATVAAIPGARQLGSVLAQSFSAPQAALRALGQRITRVGAQMRGMMIAARRFFLAGGLSVGGILVGAARGTVEADNFKQALDRLVRTVGDRFAPYVRATTDLLGRMESAWKSLSMETQNSITKWATVSVALAGVAAILPVLIRGIGSLISTLALFVSPITLGVAALAILAETAYQTWNDMSSAALASAKQIDLANRTWVESLADYLETASSYTDRFFERLSRHVSDLQFNLSRGLGYSLTWLAVKLGALDNPNNVVLIGAQQDFLAEQKERNQRLIGQKDFLGRMGGLKDRFQDFMKGLGEGDGFNRHGTSNFESFQGTWDRMQKHFSEGSEERLEKQMVDALNAAKVALEKANDQLDLIAERLPLVA